MHACLFLFCLLFVGAIYVVSCPFLFVVFFGQVYAAYQRHLFRPLELEVSKGFHGMF